MGGAENGEFWADEIKRHKDDPEKRLQIAREHMPSPAAFREAVVALRALIRERRKRRQEYVDLLRDLYLMAARENFLLGTAYVEDIGPGYNVASSIPRSSWEGLGMPYKEIGYEKLGLLTKTDKKWLVQTWGEPGNHQSAQQYHEAIWKEAVAEYRRQRRAEDERSTAELQKLLESFKPPADS